MNPLPLRPATHSLTINLMDAKSIIENGKAILGIELGSTRIKAVLITPDNHPIAQGYHNWENQLIDGLWTYSIEDIWHGLQDCYASLRANVKKQYNVEIKTLAAIGVSAMMHGYMAFNQQEKILVPFRTWRNTNTPEAASVLSESLQMPFSAPTCMDYMTRPPAKRTFTGDDRHTSASGKHEKICCSAARPIRERDAARPASRGKIFPGTILA